MAIYFDFARYVFPVCPYETLISKLYAGGLAGYFDQEKIVDAVESMFY